MPNTRHADEAQRRLDAWDALVHRWRAALDDAIAASNRIDTKLRARLAGRDISLASAEMARARTAWANERRSRDAVDDFLISVLDPAQPAKAKRGTT
jgi:hypothetical protein